MALKVPFLSSLAFLDAVIAANLENSRLRLYSNNHVPADTDTVADYTECTFPGYASILLAGWPAAALNPSNKASTELPEQDFVGGVILVPEDIYGIYVTDPGGNLLYAELNPIGVVSMAFPGQIYGYIPVFTDKSEF